MLDFEDREAAFQAGRRLGNAERVEFEAEERVHELLHTQALEALGMARRLALVKGPAWAAMVVGEDQ